MPLRVGEHVPADLVPIGRRPRFQVDHGAVAIAHAAGADDVEPLAGVAHFELQRLQFGAVQVRRVAKSQHRSEEHTSELQSLMRISYAVFCLKKKQNKQLITIRFTPKKK